MSEELEKRKSKRIAYPCEVEFYGSKGGRVDGKITVLSLRGAFVETPSTQPVGMRLTLRFSLPTGVMTVTAEVAHSEEKGIGVHFLAMTRAQHAALERVLGDGT
jgi:hypothetical protein